MTTRMQNASSLIKDSVLSNVDVALDSVCLASPSISHRSSPLWLAYLVGISVCIQRGVRCFYSVGPISEWESPNCGLWHSEKKEALELKTKTQIQSGSIHGTQHLLAVCRSIRQRLWTLVRQKMKRKSVFSTRDALGLQNIHVSCTHLPQVSRISCWGWEALLLCC